MGKEMNKIPRKIVLCLFIGYLLLVFLLVFYKGWGGIKFLHDSYANFEIRKQSILFSLNFIPLRFIFDANGYTAYTWIVNVGGNIALFVPMGIFLPVLHSKVRKWGWVRFILCAVSLVTVIEVVQLFLMCGQCDIDDIILNVAGMCIGFACFKLPLFKK